MSAVFNLNVTKRSGKKEPLDIDKIHKVVEEACRDIHNVSASLVEINSGLQFTDDISTDDIQNILIKSAADLISLDSPNYQYVAARLLIFSLVKRVFGDYKYPSISEPENKRVRIRSSVIACKPSSFWNCSNMASFTNGSCKPTTQ